MSSISGENETYSPFKEFEMTQPGKGGDVGAKALRVMHNCNLPSNGSFYLKCHQQGERG
jgi:hypothetical protein